MKIKVLPWAVGVAILGCVLAVSANVTTSKMYDSLNHERHVRMQSEQNLQIASATIKTLEARLAESQKKFESIEAILNQGKATANDLQAKLDQVMQEKESLAKKMTELEQQAAAPKPEAGAKVSR